MNDAEKSVISSIIVYGQPALERVVAVISQEDFFNPEYRKLYQAAIELSNKGTPIDIITLSDASGVNIVDVSNAASDSGTIENVHHHACIVRNRSSLLKINRIASAALRTCNDSTSDATTIIGNMVADLSSIHVGSKSVVHIGQVVDAIAKKCEHYEGSACGIRTGLRVLDNMLTFNGYPCGQVTVIAAATSKGKSSLAAKAIHAAALDGTPSLMCNFEDSVESTVTRLLACDSGINNSMLQRGQVDKDDWRNFSISAGRLSNANVYFINKRLHIEELCIEVKSQVKKYGIKLLVIDYLQLIQAHKGFGKKQEIIDYIFGMVVDLALQLPETATILVSQLSRTHNAKPTSENLYHSGSIEQGAHTIMLLWEPELKSTYGAKMCIISKQKNGPVGDVVLGWDNITTSFRDPSPELSTLYRTAVETHERGLRSEKKW